MEVSTFKNVKGYIFDVDGTLLDSHESHYRAWDRVTKVHGVYHEKENIVKHFGKTTPNIAIALFERDDRDFIDSVSKEKARYFLEEIPASTVIDGSIPVLKAVKDLGMKVCLASSNYRFVIQKVLDTFGFANLIDDYTGLDDITRGKPDPEMVKKSSLKLELDPSDCIMVGDSIYDIQAGKVAGCYSVGVCTGIFNREQLMEAGADLVLDSIKGLLPYVEG